MRKKNDNNIVILDTAGRLHIDEDMMRELQEIKETVRGTSDDSGRRCDDWVRMR